MLVACLTTRTNAANIDIVKFLAFEAKQPVILYDDFVKINFTTDFGSFFDKLIGQLMPMYYKHRIITALTSQACSRHSVYLLDEIFRQYLAEPWTRYLSNIT